MGRNLPASKRGWGYDAIRKTLDIFVDGVLTTKIGTPAVGRGDFNIYAESATQLHDIGTRLEVDDRVFRYSRAGSTTAALLGSSLVTSQPLLLNAPLIRVIVLPAREYLNTLSSTSSLVPIS